MNPDTKEPLAPTPDTCDHSKHYVTVAGTCCGCGVQMLAQEGVVVEPFPRRPTPNTDCAYQFKARVSENPCEPNEHSEYMTSLCRVLERQRDEGWQERDEARALMWEARNAFHAKCDENAELKAERARLQSMSVVEMMCENLNVKHFVEEWEQRCLKAEAEAARLRAALDAAPRGIHSFAATLQENERLKAEAARLKAKVEQMEGGENLIMEAAHKVADEFKAEASRLREALQKVRTLAHGSSDKVSCLITIDAIQRIAAEALAAVRGEKEGK